MAVLSQLGLTLTLTVVALFSLLASLPGCLAASAEEWRSRSVYQLITDRFAPATPNAPCNTGDRSYCGGNYQSIISKLDYIQGMGFDAIWISPVAQNIEGRFLYGEPYHGFWTTDQTKLNPHFGSDFDLKALSSALHSRNMLLMVDMALNHLASTSTDISSATLASDAGGTLLFKDPADYHKPCGIQWGNHTSEEYCWMATASGGSNDIALMDLATETDAVGDVFRNWVGGWVKEYGVDGLRLDATKHMSKEFQSGFCAKAGIFCTGEVFGDDVGHAAGYMGSGGIDAVLGFGMMYGLTRVFAGGNKKTMPTLQFYVNQNSKYPDASVIQVFLDNHDLPRFFSTNPDPASARNAIVGNFLISGMPTVYYGLEQEVSFGAADPDNRDALWKYNDYSTQTGSYLLIKKLNEIRKGLSGTGSGKWHETTAKVGSVTDSDITLERDGVLIALTNRGSSGSGPWTIKTGLPAGIQLVDVVSCSTTGHVGSDGAFTISWNNGQPYVFVPKDRATQAGLCGAASLNSTSTSSLSSTSTSSASSMSVSLTKTKSGSSTFSSSTSGSVNATTSIGSSTSSSFASSSSSAFSSSSQTQSDSVSPTSSGLGATASSSLSLSSSGGDLMSTSGSPSPTQVDDQTPTSTTSTENGEGGSAGLVPTSRLSTSTQTQGADQGSSNSNPASPPSPAPSTYPGTSTSDADGQPSPTSSLIDVSPDQGSPSASSSLSSAEAQPTSTPSSIESPSTPSPTSATSSAPSQSDPSTPSTPSTALPVHPITPTSLPLPLNAGLTTSPTNTATSSGSGAKTPYWVDGSGSHSYTVPGASGGYNSGTSSAGFRRSELRGWLVVSGLVGLAIGANVL